MAPEKRWLERLGLRRTPAAPALPEATVVEADDAREWVLLETLPSPAIAELHANMLRAASIPAWVRDWGQTTATLGGGFMGASVYIPAVCLAAARDVVSGPTTEEEHVDEG